MNEQIVTKYQKTTGREGVTKIVQIGMLSALAYMLMVLIRIPVVLFLKYEPKDVIIALGGFILGPMASLLISLIVGVVEMVTVSETGVIGCIMNILSSVSFTCIAAYVYKKEHSRRGALKGLLLGGLTMTAVMLLWNYLVTPLYMGYPRDAVAAMLLPYFLPFNLLKAGLNSAILLLIYKPVVTALRKARLLAPGSGSKEAEKRSNTIGAAIVALLVVVTCVLVILSMQGLI